MAVPGANWHEFGEPVQDQEAEALRAVRALLPQRPTVHAWTNVTFRDREGRAGEIDVILLHDAGLFLLELKGWHGRIVGDQQTWRVTAPNGAVRTERDPYIVTNGKAQRLKSELRNR